MNITSTCFIVQTTGFNRPAKFLTLLKHWGYDNFELNWFHGLSKSLAIPLSQVLDLFTLSWETSTKHPRSVRGNFIPILEITRDESPME